MSWSIYCSSCRVARSTIFSRFGRCNPSKASRTFIYGRSSPTRFCMIPITTAHLLFNMFGLWMFGSGIERYVGPRRLLACYFASVVTAALAQLTVPMMFGAPPGADGRRFRRSLRFDAGLRSPVSQEQGRRVFLIPMPTWLFATLYAGLELFQGVTGHSIRGRALRPPRRHGRQRPGDLAVAPRAGAPLTGAARSARLSG